VTAIAQEDRMLALSLTALSLVHVVSAPLPHVSAGRVSGTRAYVALSLDHGRLRAYVCDGTPRREPTVARWLRGRWDGHSPLTLRGGRVVLRIERVARGRVRGRVGGHRFTARPAHGAAGLFDGRGDGVRATWIALDRRHIRGTFVPARPPRCKVVAVTAADGSVRYVSTCG
jgi:hypothetical protein